jgi:hypothetical protein
MFIMTLQTTHGGKGRFFIDGNRTILMIIYKLPRLHPGKKHGKGDATVAIPLEVPAYVSNVHAYT